MGVRVLNGVIGGEARGGVFPNQTLDLGGRRLTTGGRRHRRLADALVDGELGEQGEGMLDHVGLAVRSLFFHADAEGGVVSVVEVVGWRDHYGCCAEDGFPSTPEHRKRDGGGIARLGATELARVAKTVDAFQFPSPVS